VRVEHRSCHVMMYLDRITVAPTCGDPVEDAEDVKGGKDDRVFRLDRVDLGMCRAER
jgi:hypothetical protein